MGGCQAAIQAGWSALCGATGILAQVQDLMGRATGAGADLAGLGPLQAGMLLVAGLVALAVAWQVFLVLCRALYAVYPYAIALGVALLLFNH